MKWIVYGMVVLLAIVHQDFWWWDRIDPLVFGFIPIGLAYHAGVSIAAGVLWALAVKYCWPANLQDEDEAATSGRSASGGRA